MKTSKFLLVAVIVAFAQASFSQSIHAEQNCDPPFEITLSYLTDEIINIGWYAESETEWNVEIGEAGFAPGAGDHLIKKRVKGVPFSQNSCRFYNLPAGGTLHAYIKSVCACGTNSEWIGPVSFIIEPTSSVRSK